MSLPPPLVKSLHTGLLLFACQSNQYLRHLHSPLPPATKKWKELKIFTHAFLPVTSSVAELICASKKRYDTSWIDTSVSCDRFPPGQVFTILRLRTRDCGLGEVKLWCEHSNLSTRPLVSSSPHRLVSSQFILSPPRNLSSLNIHFPISLLTLVCFKQSFPFYVLRVLYSHVS